MRPTDEQCTCWRAKTIDGERRPAAWLLAHERIAVTTTDGHRFEGRPDGMAWSTLEHDDAAPWLYVDQDDGSDAAVSHAEVETITPLHTTDPKSAVNLVVEALAHPFDLPEEGAETMVIVGDHDVVEISVVRRRQGCQSLTPPEPRVVFDLVLRPDPPTA